MSRRFAGAGRVVRSRLLVAVPILVLTSIGMFALGAASPIDDPLPVQYLRWIGNLLRGDLGWSTSRHEPVASVIAARAGWTLLLVTLSRQSTGKLSVVTRRIRPAPAAVMPPMEVQSSRIVELVVRVR